MFILGFGFVHLFLNVFGENASITLLKIRREMRKVTDWMKKQELKKKFVYLEICCILSLYSCISTTRHMNRFNLNMYLGKLCYDAGNKEKWRSKMCTFVIFFMN